MDLIENHIWVQIAVNAIAIGIYGWWRYRKGYKEGEKTTWLRITHFADEQGLDTFAKALRALYSVRFE